MDRLNSDGNIVCRTAWISDVHLGNPNCKADHLLLLLSRLRCERLYLVGDIVDVWAMQRRVFWPQLHNNVLRKLLSLSRKGIEVIYIPGNHDENFREFCGHEFGNVKVARNAVHTTADGRRFLVTHGDELDFAVRYSRINRLIGDIAYDGIMMFNRWLNHLRGAFGKPYWSLARWVKSNVAQAGRAIQAYQGAAVDLAREKRMDGIICGHLHYPLIRDYDGTLYCNDGDWVENCTALLEDGTGRLHLVQAMSAADLVVAEVSVVRSLG